jgi:hypothetical protein
MILSIHDGGMQNNLFYFLLKDEAGGLVTGGLIAGGLIAGRLIARRLVTGRLRNTRRLRTWWR